MELGFELTQQLQTKLVITPELRQSITILQYPTLDLIGFLRSKADENPLIELEEPEAVLWDKRKHELSPKPWEDEELRSDPEYHEEYSNPIDYYVQRDGSLHSYLMEQAGYLDIPPKLRQVVHYLIGNVNEQGYLEAEFDMLPSSLQATQQDWDQAISILQQLEPLGVGARNLEECLLIQLQAMEGRDDLTATIIRYHLKDIAAKRYQKIAAKLKVKPEEVQQVADFISTLQPKPGMLFHSQEARYVIPDVYVEKRADGKLIVQLNDRLLPKLHVNKQYLEMLKEGTEAQSYLEEQLQQVQWLEKSLKQRQQTILKVMRAIIEVQQDFFLHDQHVLKPLTLKQIAEAINMHESTVSRATNHKYVQTAQGVYELKYFFSNRLASNDDSSSTSSFQVKQWIQRLIEQEDKRKPLSDQKIAQQLQSEGTVVARRTVAKYREELGLLPSSQRKRI